MKKVLLWIALVFLIILVLIPPALRLFGKNLYIKVEEKKDVVTVLNCLKNEENISTTYLNDVPYNFKYTLNGNYSNDREESEKDEYYDVQNAIVNDIKNTVTSTYNKMTDITTFSIVLTMVEMQKESMKNYVKNPKEQQDYYHSIGFICTRTDV